jgi:hypothetical protein
MVPSNLTPPKPEVLNELISYLETDETLYGVIYRNKRDGLSNDEIQSARGAAYPNFIWNYQRYLKALLEGDIPSGVSLMNEVSVLCRKLLKQDSFSDSTKLYLSSCLNEIDTRKSDPVLQVRTQNQVAKASSELERKSTSGVYVYSLMHYLTYPYDPDSGRTLMKVGMSDRDVIRRFREQIRTTALPEEPILLRIYESKAKEFSLTEIEKKFHNLLEAADHDRSKARTGGTEWFLTSLKFLDKIAETLKLDVITNKDLDSEG